jgi:large subunit ribosomal protein L25
MDPKQASVAVVEVPRAAKLAAEEAAAAPAEGAAPAADAKKAEPAKKEEGKK